MKKLFNNGLQDEIHLGIYFGTILVDFGHQVGGHVPPRRPKTAQIGAQDGPRVAQEVPKTGQEPPKTCPRSDQEPAKTCPGARGCPRAVQIPSRPRCWTILATIVEHIC